MDELGKHSAERINFNIFLLQERQLLVQSLQLFQQRICCYTFASKFLVKSESFLCGLSAVAGLRDHGLKIWGGKLVVPVRRGEVLFGSSPSS